MLKSEGDVLIKARIIPGVIVRPIHTDLMVLMGTMDSGAMDWLTIGQGAPTKPSKHNHQQFGFNGAQGKKRKPDEQASQPEEEEDKWKSGDEGEDGRWWDEEGNKKWDEKWGDQWDKDADEEEDEEEEEEEQTPPSKGGKGKGSGRGRFGGYSGRNNQDDDAKGKGARAKSKGKGKNKGKDRKYDKRTGTNRDSDSKGNIQQRLNEHDQIIVILDKQVREQELHHVTAGFLYESSEWFEQLDERAQSWTFAVKKGKQKDLYSPVVHLGAGIIGLFMKLLNDDDTYNWATENELVEWDTVEKWKTWHQTQLQEKGPKSIEDSLATMVIQNKGKYKERNARGKYEARDDAEDRLLVKLGPKARVAHLWQPVLEIFRMEVERQGGYISQGQPPGRIIRKLRGW